MAVIKVDLQKKQGKIKPLHGVNNGPKTANLGIDTTDSFKKAAIPYVRLHDTEYPYGSGHFVDIHCVFPNFDADPDDPGSYDFFATDEYIKAIFESGAKPFYRLGESIEHPAKKYHIFPPKDNLKWAKICGGIISHYTKGWADGFYYDMQYWEIWNEPDCIDKPEYSTMWQGTKEQFFELYVTAANYLKDKFPDLKIGGYASCGFYAADLSGAEKENINPDWLKRLYYFIEFFHDFMKYISNPAHTAPLDFFSWHEYASNPDKLVKHAVYVREQLDIYGFGKTESILNEWNYSGENQFVEMKNIPGASFAAAAFCGLQNAPLDYAMYYTGETHFHYGGLYENSLGKETKTYLSFEYFGKMYRMGTQFLSESDTKEIYSCAAGGIDGEIAVMVVNYNQPDTEIELKLIGGSNKNLKLLLLDAARDMEKIDEFDAGSKIKFSLPKNSVAFLCN